MIGPERQRLLDCLAELVELSPDIRFGQLLVHLAFLTEGRTETNLRNIDDEPLLDVMREHREELLRRHQPVG